MIKMYVSVAVFQVWRFITYQFVHVNMEHIVFNTLMQLMVGVPLEISQPGWAGTAKYEMIKENYFE